MADELKPEAVEAIKRLHEQGKALMEALADLARQGEYEFKQHPGREFMDRTEAMRNVMRIRDAYTRMSHGARAALVALGRTAGEKEVPAYLSPEGCKQFAEHAAAGVALPEPPYCPLCGNTGHAPGCPYAAAGVTEVPRG